MKTPRRGCRRATHSRAVQARVRGGLSFPLAEVTRERGLLGGRCHTPGTTRRFWSWGPGNPQGQPVLPSHVRGRVSDATTRQETFCPAASTPRAPAATILKPSHRVTAPGGTPSARRLGHSCPRARHRTGLLLGVVTVGAGGRGPPVSGDALPLLLHQDVQPHRRLRILNLGDTQHHHDCPAGRQSWPHTCLSTPQFPSPGIRHGQAKEKTDESSGPAPRPSPCFRAPAHGREGPKAKG